MGEEVTGVGAGGAAGGLGGFGGSDGVGAKGSRPPTREREQMGGQGHGSKRTSLHGGGGGMMGGVLAPTSGGFATGAGSGGMGLGMDGGMAMSLS